MSHRIVRWVVAVTALLALSGAGRDWARIGPRAQGAETSRVYVGTYTDGASRGIYKLELDLSSGTWASGPALAAVSKNPSFLAFDPNGRFLYAVNEVANFQHARTGSVSAFAVNTATGRLTLLNRQRSEGADPCHVVVDACGRNVLVANYTGGSVATLPLAGNGRLQRASTVRHRIGSGPVRPRQESSHTHAVVLDPTGRFAISTDLGTDRIFVDRFDGAAGRLEPNDPESIGLPPGSGPRHLAWHPSGRVLYVVNELSSTVSVLRFDAARGALEIVQTISTRPAGAAGPNTAAEIVVSPDGRFLYASNRGDDSIAVFATDAGLGLAAVGHVKTGGRVPRSFAMDPSGRWLVVANQGSNSLDVFRVDATTGLPAPVGATIAVPEPVCVVFPPSTRKMPEARAP